MISLLLSSQLLVSLLFALILLLRQLQYFFLFLDQILVMNFDFVQVELEPSGHSHFELYLRSNRMSGLFSSTDRAFDEMILNSPACSSATLFIWSMNLNRLSLTNFWCAKMKNDCSMIGSKIEG